MLTAAGGVLVSYAAPDVSVALTNPALLNPLLHAQVNLTFTQVVAGINGYSLAGAVHDKKSSTTFGAGVFFLNYGQLQATDAAGNQEGTFRANDYVLQVSAGRHYLQKWHYGATLKFIQSSYQVFRSTALAADVGLYYTDTAKGVSIGVVAKNMGSQVKKYAGEPEELPFDLQAGITKKLAKAPLAFSATIQQAHRFNLLYHDTTFNNETNAEAQTSFSNKLLQHFVFASHIFISKQLELTLGYNHLRRTDLSIGTTSNGLAGFSAGFAARFEKLQVSYARTSYQRGASYNQFGLNLLFDKLFGAGTF